MSKEPYKKLDPHVAVRAPDTLPKLVRMGMYRLIMRTTGGSDPTPDDFIKAFNIITWSLITAGTTRSAHTDSKLRQRGSGKLRKVLKTGKRKTTKKTAAPKAKRDGSEARVKIDPKDPTRVVLTKIGEDVERVKLKRPAAPSRGKAPRARSRKKEPWVPFDEKARAIAGWASSIYDDDPTRYELTYQEAKRRGT